MKLLRRLGLLAGLALASAGLAAVPEGYLDVTTLGADRTGRQDSTAAIRQAIDQAREQGLAVWFPAGDYLISQRIEVDQPDNEGDKPTVLVGSTADPARRATLVLAEKSPEFGDPAKRRAMVHFFNLGPAENEKGNADLYHHGVIGLDFRVLPGNDGAIALRLQGAEGCTIQDVRIDLTRGGHTGLWGLPASGGATHTVTVLGGRVGIDTRPFRNPEDGGGGTQPQPVVTGATLLNQSEYAVRATTRGSLVLVGCRIERDTPGPVIWIRRHWQGQPFDGSVQLVDSVIAYAKPDPANTVVALSTEDHGRGFVFENTYIRHAPHVLRPDIPARAEGWTHFRRLAVAVHPKRHNKIGATSEPIYVNGAVHGELLVDAGPAEAPPANFLARHLLPADFPTWETRGAANVKTLGAKGDGETDDHRALQAAIDAHEIVFLPKGVYRVSDTLRLRPNTKLIGVHHAFSVIHAIDTLKQRFGGTSDSSPAKPIVSTADSAEARTAIAFLHIRRAFPLATHNPTAVGNYALEWRSGPASIVRHIKLEAKPTVHVRPDQIARNFYNYDTTAKPIDRNHPQASFEPGHHAWPCSTPNVQIRGNGGGRWFTFWFHGRQGLRENVPFLRAEGTRQPLHFYHLHGQQQDSLNHFEFIQCENITVYGTKGEIKGAMVLYKDSRHIRHFGHSGMSSPDPAVRPPHLFRFINCEDFLIAGINDTVNPGADRWVGTPYDRWVHANINSWFPLIDQASGRPELAVPSLERPILYLRGQPRQ